MRGLLQQLARFFSPSGRPFSSSDFGPASWVKEIITTSHNNNEVKLRDLVSGDPEDPDDRNWRNGEPDEVEVEWQLLQTEFNKADGGRNGELVGAPEDLNQGDEIITRRYEFYKYVGPIDVETGEAMTDSVGPDGIHGFGDYADSVVVGDYLGAQMSAFDHELPVGLVDHLADGEIDVAYDTRAVVIAGVPFTATTTGALPAGMTFTATSGQVSGTPKESGIFTFGVRVTSTNNPVLVKTYTLAIAGAGEVLPPHCTVDTSAWPADSGLTTGDGLYTNDTVATVTATPAAGFAFSKWTENGRTVSTSASYPFTNIVNRALVANFVPRPPPLAYSPPQSGTLVLTWPTNGPALLLQQNSDLGTTNWMTAPEAVSIDGTNRRVTISPLTGNRFFRLLRP